MRNARPSGRWRRAGMAAAATTLAIGLGGVIAGCGSSDDTTGASGGSSSGGRQARRGRLLDPGDGLRGEPRARLQEDLSRLRRQLQQLLRRLRRPESRSRGRAAGFGRALRPGRRHDPSGRCRARRIRLGQAEVQRDRPGLGRRHDRPQGQPRRAEDTRRPAQQGRQDRHPEPVQLRAPPAGTSWRSTGRRSTRASPPSRRSTRSRPCSGRPRCSRAALATRWRRSPRARATCSSPTRTRRSTPRRRARTSTT